MLACNSVNSAAGQGTTVNPSSPNRAFIVSRIPAKKRVAAKLKAIRAVLQRRKHHFTGGSANDWSRRMAAQSCAAVDASKSEFQRPVQNGAIILAESIRCAALARRLLRTDYILRIPTILSLTAAAFAWKLSNSAKLCQG
jgi:hypothetical protein